MLLLFLLETTLPHFSNRLASAGQRTPLSLRGKFFLLFCPPTAFCVEKLCHILGAYMLADLWPKRDLCQKLVETWMKNGKRAAFASFHLTQGTCRYCCCCITKIRLCLTGLLFGCESAFYGKIDWNPFYFFLLKSLYLKQQY